MVFEWVDVFGNDRFHTAKLSKGDVLVQKQNRIRDGKKVVRWDVSYRPVCGVWQDHLPARRQPKDTTIATSCEDFERAKQLAVVWVAGNAARLGLA